MRATMDFGSDSTGRQIMKLGLAVGVGLGVGYLVGKKLGGGRVNTQQDLTNPKVVNVVDMEDMGDKKSFCRCWKSKNFPYCDGSHNEHNATTGDNVGPLCIKHKS